MKGLRKTARLGCGIVALAAASACGNEGGGAGPGGGVGQVDMELFWDVAANLDVGATTPDGILSANFPGNDPNCSHGGDEGLSGSPPYTETMSCAAPAAPGSYIVVVDNNESFAVDYTVRVSVDGRAHAGSPVSGTVPGGGSVSHTFTI